MNSSKSIVAVLFGAVFLFLSYAYLSQSSDTVRNIPFLLSSLLAVLTSIYAVRTYHLGNVHGKAMALLTAGMLCFFIGESLFDYYQYVAHTDPFPSIADIFYLLAYPAIFAGLMLEVRQRKMSWDKVNKLVLVLILLLLSAFAIIILYFGVFLAYNAGDPLLNNVISMSYGIADLILVVPSLLVLKLAAEYKGGKLFNAWTMVLLAIILMMTADVLYAIYTDQYNNVEWPFISIDIAWAASYLLFAYSFFYTGATINDSRSMLLKSPKKKK